MRKTGSAFLRTRFSRVLRVQDTEAIQNARFFSVAADSMFCSGKNVKLKPSKIVGQIMFQGGACQPVFARYSAFFNRLGRKVSLRLPVLQVVPPAANIKKSCLKTKF